MTNEQLSIVLESVSFVLVTLDLYGEDRLTSLNHRVTFNLEKLVKISNVSINDKINNKLFLLMVPLIGVALGYKFITRIFTTDTTGIDSFIVSLVENLSESDKEIKILVEDVKNNYTSYMLKFISFVVTELMFSLILLIGLFILGWKLLSIWVSISIILIIIILSIIFFESFGIYLLLSFMYLSTIVVTFPLFVLKIFIAPPLFLFKKLKLNNIMLFVGTLLFFISRYLAFKFGT